MDFFFKSSLLGPSLNKSVDPHFGARFSHIHVAHFCQVSRFWVATCRLMDDC